MKPPKKNEALKIILASLFELIDREEEIFSSKECGEDFTPDFVPDTYQDIRGILNKHFEIKEK